MERLAVNFGQLFTELSRDGRSDINVINEAQLDAGLDPSAYRQCMASGKAAAAVQKHVDEGAKFGVSGTPGFFVNGRFLNGALPLETFVQVVEEELGR